MIICLLTHLPLDKMAILADDIFKCIFLNENDIILIQISLKFVPKGLIDNDTALVDVKVSRRTGEKPLPEPMPTQFTDAYMRHQGAVSIRKTVLPGMAIPMLKIRRPNGRLIFNMEIAIRR